MEIIRRKPNAQPAFTKAVDQAKNFNKGLRYVQGVRAQLAANSRTPVQVSLNASGKKLLGISVFPVSGNLTDLADTQVKFVVNNNNLLLSVGAQNLNPNFVNNMIFFPTPQDLFGNDSISLEFEKNDSGEVFIMVNLFYVPRM